MGNILKKDYTILNKKIVVWSPIPEEQRKIFINKINMKNRKNDKIALSGISDYEKKANF